MLLALAAFSMLLLPTLTTLLLLKPGTHTPLTWSLVTCTPHHSPLETRLYNYGKIEDILHLEYEGKRQRRRCLIHDAACSDSLVLMMESMSLS